MSGLAALLAEHNPPSVYQWHSAAPVPDVQHAVEVAGWCFRYLDGWTIEDRASFVKAAGVALELPDTDSIEALASALGTIDCGDHGLVLLWDGWSPLARKDGAAFDEALATFRRRAHTATSGKLAVILRGEGPDLDVPELPIKR
jgi:hypothetical protein